jgi:CheY-like chemotaxis protein
VARVLIVEDDEAFLYVVEKRLRAAGHETLAFHDWNLVLDLLERGEAIDVLLTDIKLPAGTPTGPQLARMALKRRPDLQVIYMTAFSELAAETRQTLPQVVLKDPEAASVFYAVQAVIRAQHPGG